MIKSEDLVDGLYVKTLKSGGNLHKEFTIWGVNNYWVRFQPGFGQIAGFMTTDNMVKFLNRWQFEIIGKCEFKFYEPPALKTSEDSFDIGGALQ